MEHPILSKSPLVMAIMEIRFTPTEGNVNIENLNIKGNKVIDEEYPVFSTNKGGQVHIDVGDGTGTPKANVISTKINKYLYENKDKSRNFSISTKKLNFSSSSEYKGWDDFTKYSKVVWNEYRPLFESLKLNITGLSLRYINNITIQEKMDSPTDYFNTAIYIETDVLDGSVNDYSINYIETLPDRDITIVNNQSLKALSADELTYVFDIDVIQQKIIPFDEIWNEFEKLREIKNKKFFLNIKDKTLNLLK